MNIHQLSLDTVFAEWSTSTFERILAHLGRGGQGEGVRGRGGQGEGVRGEREGQGEGVRGREGGRTFAE